ncbi:TPA: LysR family transcriptional regulator [Legionella pneumophila]|uniref:LysR family transcriptional regulator n=1 Tax=Legionella pneumophila TaxID=446 RepID=A0AAN5P4V7_LEGPN|nr:LysR family transcriptional regulator [Legionella pneumophila]HAT9300955.1 LysR family transcriptional regulator [Legionella pneumophila subsp. pneumophila]MCO1452138.1 LysR family transcriptional regulator [Legionella pneumophila]MCZ4692315.1 LysR family transcriptional regulator [Legionella pneumophila]MCZ4711502.1 LysR family transcriptional regulator [Legionella pneumophila]MCZ4719908.1 LysR family transcriptional regulator [Legionella pneumophila]
MSKLERIATFISVIEENGFAAAARRKGVSTAAISRQITALEKELSVQLLNRTTRQISLTEIGEKYFQQCKKVLSELQEAESAITKSKNEATGSLRIVANRYFAITHILPRLSEFMELNPKVSIHFQLAERFPNLEKEGIDILFGVSIEGSSELVRRRVSTTRYILCASPGYLEKYGLPEHPSDLVKHRYITHSIRKPNNVISFKDGKEIHINPILWLNDSYAMRECAIHDIGIVNLHDYMVTEAIKNGNLIEILREYQEPHKNVYLYYQQSRYLQPKIRRFIDFYTE